MNRAFTILAALALVALTTAPAWAQAGGRFGEGGRGGQDRAGRAEARMERLSEFLALTPEQQRLFEEWRNAIAALKDSKRSAMKGQRDAFREEAAKETPNFSALAMRLKNEHRARTQVEYEYVVDAQARFYAGLTPEQRQRMSAGGRNRPAGFNHNQGAGDPDRRL